ncbi:MAG: arginine--tRNA ligase [Pseudomonadota bacterium]
MSSLAKKLSDIVGAAFEGLGLSKELGLVRVSDRPDLAQFQCNGAMVAAKEAKKNPREVAQTISDALSSNETFTKIEIAGPGFINLDVTDASIAAHLAETSADERLGVPQAGSQDKTIILDYGGMNVAKAMHVGHLRPTVIGDCLKHITRFAGYNALGDIHMGDWGLQMGQIISEFELRHPDWAYFGDGPYPAEPLFTYADLEKIYPEASSACKEDEARLELARTATAALQDGKPGYKALWQHFMDLSIADIKDNLAPLEVEFDIWKGEADVDQFIEEIGEDLKARGIAKDSDGAVVIEVVREDDNKDMPPLMFYKSDSAVTYGTTDIATIYDRIKLYDNLVKIIYVVDKRQSLHFEQVFRAAERAGYADGITLTHIGNGTVNGADGKPYKTRDGGVMTFRNMVSSTIEKAKSRLDEAELAQDMSEQERADVARKVAVAALKYTELSNQAHVDYVFDLERMTAFEGKTGPYLLYQAVRIQSLLKKAKEQGIEPADEPSYVLQDGDRPLALLLAELPDHFALALENMMPHVICEYAYKLAQEFSSFYGNCHILSQDDGAVRASRLALCTRTHAQLTLLLKLLGITIPERM